MLRQTWQAVRFFAAARVRTRDELDAALMRKPRFIIVEGTEALRAYAASLAYRGGQEAAALEEAAAVRPAPAYIVVPTVGRIRDGYRQRPAPERTRAELPSVDLPRASAAPTHIPRPDSPGTDILQFDTARSNPSSDLPHSDTGRSDTGRSSNGGSSNGGSSNGGSSNGGSSTGRFDTGGSHGRRRERRRKVGRRSDRLSLQAGMGTVIAASGSLIALLGAEWLLWPSSTPELVRGPHRVEPPLPRGVIAALPTHAPPPPPPTLYEQIVSVLVPLLVAAALAAMLFLVLADDRPRPARTHHLARRPAGAGATRYRPHPHQNRLTTAPAPRSPLFKPPGSPTCRNMSDTFEQPETATTPTGPEALMSEAARRIAELEAERDEMRDKWMRAEAEAQNIKARSRRDVDETRQYAVQKFAKDVVEAAENLRRGISSLPAATQGEPEIVTKLRDGFEGVERSFVALLERNGIQADDPVGKPFDANLHQAMAEQPTAEHPPGTVVQSWSRAWTLNGRLLRPAMVVVAKADGPSGLDTQA